MHDDAAARRTAPIRQFVCVLAMASSAAAQSPVAFRTLARGADSRIALHYELVARTAGRWQLIWHEHAGSSDAPAIDFSREMVVGVFGGSSGPDASIEIVSVQHEAGSVVVRYREKRSAYDRATKRNAIAPFHIVVVPADRAPVTFLLITSPPET